MAAITERLPTLLPLLQSVLERTCKVRVVPLVRLDRLLRAFELERDALQVFALNKRALGRIRVDAQTVLLVLVTCLCNMLLLRLLILELLLDRGYGGALMLILPLNEGGGRSFEIVANLLGKFNVETGLLFRLCA